MAEEEKEESLELYSEEEMREARLQAAREAAEEALEEEATKCHWWLWITSGLVAGWLLAGLFGYIVLRVSDFSIYSASSIAERKEALEEAQEVSRVAVLARDNAFSRLSDANAKIAEMEKSAAAANTTLTPAVAPPAVAPATQVPAPSGGIDWNKIGR